MRVPEINTRKSRISGASFQDQILNWQTVKSTHTGTVQIYESLGNRLSEIKMGASGSSMGGRLGADDLARLKRRFQRLSGGSGQVTISQVGGRIPSPVWEVVVHVAMSKT